MLDKTRSLGSCSAPKPQVCSLVCYVTLGRQPNILAFKLFSSSVKQERYQLSLWRGVRGVRAGISCFPGAISSHASRTTAVQGKAEQLWLAGSRGNPPASLGLLHPPQRAMEGLAEVQGCYNAELGSRQPTHCSILLSQPALFTVYICVGAHIITAPEDATCPRQY